MSGTEHRTATSWPRVGGVLVAVAVAAIAFWQLTGDEPTTTGLLGDEGGSWSADPFPVSGWLVELIGPSVCFSTDVVGETKCQTTSERLASPPCAQRFVHDYPDWTAEGCGREASFVDGVYRYVVGVGAEQQVFEEDHGDGVRAAPNPWFAPVFDSWQGRVVPAGTLTLHARELVYGGADVIGVDGDGVPILYVQRNESHLEEVSVFVRESGEFPTKDEVAAALELSGLPDQQLAEALVSDSRRQAAMRQVDG